MEYLYEQGADVSIKDNDGVSVTILLAIDYIILFELATYICWLHYKGPVSTVFLHVCWRFLNQYAMLGSVNFCCFREKLLAFKQKSFWLQSWSEALLRI